MRKFYIAASCLLLVATSFYFISRHHHEPNVPYASFENGDDEENEGYDGPAQRDSFENAKIIDPSLGFAPTQRLGRAMEITENLKRASIASRTQFALNWIERGPIYDSIGPSNGNTRAGVNYTSGRTLAILVDTLNDPSGNTVLAAGVAGGLWKCTNFLSTIPNWAQVNGSFNNLSISYITQDPSHSNIMYFCSGEATSNADATYGNGVYKSTDKGVTWNQLSSTNDFMRNFKIQCDASGNVYLASRTLTSPIEQPYGLIRSKDGGNTWENITPQGLTGGNAICTDIEVTSTGKLHASFGYSTGTVTHKYTSSPASVTRTGWSASKGIRINSSVIANRLELAAVADTLYAVTTNSGNNIDSCYKSIDGGATWTKQNSVLYTPDLTSGQGWYNVTLGINPTNTSEILVAGLDAYRSTNSGADISRLTYWVTTAPYVHADHHFFQWWNANGESRLLAGTDGGIFFSRDNGNSWSDKNRNLAIKQFYGASIHPTAGSPYLIAGAQDNGTHQLKYGGLGPSIEVTGGDGCYTHINQKSPNIQFASYVYNRYRRSTDGGQTWSRIDWNIGGSDFGLFVNPWDYDDSKNTLYSTYSSNNIFIWPNANTGTAGVKSLTLNGLGTPTAFKVSTNTSDRLYIGSNTGKVYRLNNASVATTASLATDLKDISSTSFPAGYINCVNTGNDDNYLVAVFTNYGVNNVWYSANGGASWTAIDGNLPDMPVRWAVFHPQFNNKLIIATEAGVYTTDAVNGANTVWTPSNSFPTVRTDMLSVRTSDNTVVAATHGRGLFTAVIPTSANSEVEFSVPTTVISEGSAVTTGCKGYTDYNVEVGIVNAPTTDATVTVSVASGNTATKGVDFDVTTNGSFTTASNQFVYAKGATTSKFITVRVYDDANVEGPESFTLTLTATGGATLGASSTHTFTINDNDRAATVTGVNNYPIGVYNSQIIAASPFASNKVKHKMQALYSAAELKAAGIYKSSAFKSLSVNVLTKNSTRPFKGLTISMANTTASNLSTGFTAQSTIAPVFSQDYTTTQGVNTFNFTTPFVWDGSSNVIVQFCFDSSATTVDDYADFVAGNSSVFGLNIRASTYSNYTTPSSTSGCSLPAAFITDFRMNATFGVEIGDSVATALNSTQTKYIDKNDDVYFYAPDGKIMARVHNLSANDYGCTQVIIDRAGKASTQFWNVNSPNYAADKTIQIIPTNNVAGKYEVTLYYTAEEKAGWELTTGKSWNDIQMISLPSAIKNVTPLNAQPDGAGTVQVLTPVRGRFGNDYTLTYTFDNNQLKSAVGAGVPGRMNTILTLNGTLSGSTINLNWSTSAEINSTAFEVEKSYDGITFHKVGTVAASGNKLTLSNYTSVDNENVQTNYFRIKMLHSDGYVLYSNTIFINNDNAPQRLFVYPNPFVTNLTIRFARPMHQMINITLYDLNGKAIQRWSEYNFAGVLQKDLSTTFMIASGYYILDVWAVGANNIHYRTKVFKQ